MASAGLILELDNYDSFAKDLEKLSRVLSDLDKAFKKTTRTINKFDAALKSSNVDKFVKKINEAETAAERFEKTLKKIDGKDLDLDSINRDVDKLQRNLADQTGLKRFKSGLASLGRVNIKGALSGLGGIGSGIGSSITGAVTGALTGGLSTFVGAGREIGLSVVEGFRDGLQGLQSILQDQGQTLLLGGTALATASAVTLAGGISAASAYESQFAGVRKTVAATEEQFAELSLQIRDLATTDNFTAGLDNGQETIALLIEQAGQLGVELDGLLPFATTISGLQLATDLGENAAPQLAKFLNILNLDVADNIGAVGATIVDLGNNLATTESLITSFSTRLAGSAGLAGLTADEILGLAAASSSLGIAPELGGTALSRVLQDFTELANVEVTDDNYDVIEFLSTLTSTADEGVGGFQEFFQSKPAEAFTEFIKGLSSLDDSVRLQALSSLDFNGIRVRDTLLRLAGNTDLLSDALGISSNAYIEQTALVNEAGQRYDTTAAKVARFKNIIRDVFIEIGQNLLPIYGKFIEGASAIALQIREFDTVLVAVIAGVGLFGVALAGVGAALIGIGALLSPIIIAFTALITLFSNPITFAAGLIGIGATLAGITLAFTVLLPILALVAGGIAGLAFSMRNDLAPIGESIANVFLAINDVIMATVNIFGQLLTIIGLYNAESSGVSSTGQSVIAFFDSLAAKIQAVVDVLQDVTTGLGFFQNLTFPETIEAPKLEFDKEDAVSQVNDIQTRIKDAIRTGNVEGGTRQTIKAGDSLSAIAAREGIDLDQLIRQNLEAGLLDPDNPTFIRAGAEIIIEPTFTTAIDNREALVRQRDELEEILALQEEAQVDERSADAAERGLQDRRSRLEILRNELSRALTSGTGDTDALREQLEFVNQQLGLTDAVLADIETNRLSPLERSFQKFADTDLFKTFFGSDEQAKTDALAFFGRLQNSFEDITEETEGLDKAFSDILSGDFVGGIDKLQDVFGAVGADILSFADAEFDFITIDPKLLQALERGDLAEAFNLLSGDLTVALEPLTEGFGDLIGEGLSFGFDAIGLDGLIPFADGIGDVVGEGIQSSIEVALGQITIPEALDNIFGAAGIETSFSDSLESLKDFLDDPALVAAADTFSKSLEGIADALGSFGEDLTEEDKALLEGMLLLLGGASLLTIAATLELVRVSIEGFDNALSLLFSTMRLAPPMLALDFLMDFELDTDIGGELENIRTNLQELFDLGQESNETISDLFLSLIGTDSENIANELDGFVLTVERAFLAAQLAVANSINSIIDSINTFLTAITLPNVQEALGLDITVGGAIGNIDTTGLDSQLLQNAFDSFTNSLGSDLTFEIATSGTVTVDDISVADAPAIIAAIDELLASDLISDADKDALRITRAVAVDVQASTNLTFNPQSGTLVPTSDEVGTVAAADIIRSQLGILGDSGATSETIDLGDLNFDVTGNIVPNFTELDVIDLPDDFALAEEPLDFGEIETEAALVVNASFAANGLEVNLADFETALADALMDLEVPELDANMLAENVLAFGEQGVDFDLNFDAAETLGIDDSTFSEGLNNAVASLLESGFSIDSISAKLGELGIGTDVANALIEGIATGLTDNSTGADAGVDDVVASVKTAFESGFGIESPSKVTQGYGQDLIDGLVLGMQSNTDAFASIIADIEEQLSAMPEAFDGAFADSADSVAQATDQLLQLQNTLIATQRLFQQSQLAAPTSGEGSGLSIMPSPAEVAQMNVELASVFMDSFEEAFGISGDSSSVTEDYGAALMQGLADGMADNFGALVAQIDAIISQFQRIVAAAQAAVGGVTSAFNQMAGAAGNFASTIAGAVSIAIQQFGSLSSAANELAGAVSSALSLANELSNTTIPIPTGGGGGTSTGAGGNTIDFGGAFATGGIVDNGSFAIVGDVLGSNAGELIFANTDLAVLNNKTSKAFMAGMEFAGSFASGGVVPAGQFAQVGEMGSFNQLMRTSMPPELTMQPIVNVQVTRTFSAPISIGSVSGDISTTQLTNLQTTLQTTVMEAMQENDNLRSLDDTLIESGAI